MLVSIDNSIFCGQTNKFNFKNGINNKYMSDKNPWNSGNIGEGLGWLFISIGIAIILIALKFSGFSWH